MEKGHRALTKEENEAMTDWTDPIYEFKLAMTSAATDVGGVTKTHIQDMITICNDLIARDEVLMLPTALRPKRGDVALKYFGNVASLADLVKTNNTPISILVAVDQYMDEAGVEAARLTHLRHWAANN